MSKVWWCQWVYKRRYSIAHTGWVMDKQGYKHSRTHVRTHMCKPTRKGTSRHASPRTHTHTKTKMQYFLLFDCNNDTCLNVTLYVYCQSCLTFVVLWLVIFTWLKHEYLKWERHWLKYICVVTIVIIHSKHTAHVGSSGKDFDFH